MVLIAKLEDLVMGILNDREIALALRNHIQEIWLLIVKWDLYSMKLGVYIQRMGQDHDQATKIYVFYILF